MIESELTSSIKEFSPIVAKIHTGLEDLKDLDRAHRGQNLQKIMEVIEIIPLKDSKHTMNQWGGHFYTNREKLKFKRKFLIKWITLI